MTKKISALMMTLISVLSLASFSAFGADVKAPANVSKITTKVNSTDAAISWGKVKGAKGYRFYMWNESQKKWIIGIKSTSELGAEISSLTPGKKYTFGVKAYKKSGKKTIWSKKVTKVSILTKPASVKKLTATPDNKSIKLSWKEAEGAKGYRIYQYNSKDKTWKNLKTTSALSYTVKDLKAGTKYTFAIKAYAKADDMYSWSQKRTSVKTATKPAAPKSVKYTATTSAVNLSWSKSAGATGYKIYIRDSKTKSWKTAANGITSLSVTISKLSPGKTYTFGIKPYIKLDGATVWGDYASVTATTTSKKVTTTATTTIATTAAQGTSIYRTKSGSKYHYLNPCGSGTYYKVTLDQAKKAGLEPCKKCVLK